MDTHSTSIGNVRMNESWKIEKIEVNSMLKSGLFVIQLNLSGKVKDG